MGVLLGKRNRYFGGRFATVSRFATHSPVALYGVMLLLLLSNKAILLVATGGVKLCLMCARRDHVRMSADVRTYIILTIVSSK